MHTIAEFKIENPDQTWEQTAVIKTHRCNSVRKANKVASELADEHGAEVRWNWRGSQQGHYVGTPIANRRSKIVRVK